MERRQEQHLMKASSSGRIPRWLTAIFMFIITLALTGVTYFIPIFSALYYYIIILFAVVFWIHVDNQPPEEIGIKFEGHWVLQLILGAIVASVVLGLIIWFEVLIGWIILTPLYLGQSIWIIIGLLAVYTINQGLVAFSEELVSRGYIQQNLASRVSIPFAILISSIMFATFHVWGMVFHSVPPLTAGIWFFNLFLGGIMLGLAFAWIRTLWLPIGLHFGWNFMLYHIAGFGFQGEALFQVQNVGPVILTGGILGPEGGLMGTLAFGFLVVIILVWAKASDGELMRTFDPKPLLLFLFGVLVVAVPVVTGLLLAGFWWVILIWFIFMAFFLQVWENRILCSHCPHYASEGRILRCHANYGLLKLWKYNPGPMSLSEQIQFIIAIAIFIGLPFPFLILGQQWLWVILGSFGAIILATVLFGWLCLRCVNFSCPFNRVPKDIVDNFLKENTEMRKGWEEKGYRLGPEQDFD
jgi:membrane protease YdiL (CAAX protease family)